MYPPYTLKSTSCGLIQDKKVMDLSLPFYYFIITVFNIVIETVNEFISSEVKIYEKSQY